MPGISLICDFERDITDREAEIFRALDSMLHTSEYKREILLRNRQYLLGSTRYEDYPIQSFESDDSIILLEGELYGLSFDEVKLELCKLTNMIGQAKEDNYDRLRTWLLNTDGVFVITVVSKDGNSIAIINDALGLLPLYYWQDNKGLQVSREIRFITSLRNEMTFDRLGMGQYMLFRYTLGERTLFQNIRRLRPAAMVRVDFLRQEVRLDEILRFNFDEKHYRDRTVEENAEELTKIFDHACMKRASIRKDYKNILFLSGGLDSRAVGASLKKNGIPFYAVSHTDGRGIYERDVNTAKDIAQILGIDWRLIRLKPPKGKDHLSLMKMKSGQNYLGMSFILAFLQQIREIYSSKMVVFTGDVGSPLKHVSPMKKLNSLDEVISYVLAENACFPLSEVARAVRIDENELRHEISATLNDYPETSLDQKYVHFIIYERGFNWNNEGIDRNRFYFWQATPMWSSQFLHYSMNCPDDQKSYFKLYRNFLFKLSPEVATINDSNYDLPLGSARLLLRLFILSMLPRKLKDVIKKYMGKNFDNNRRDSTIYNCIEDQMRNCEAISNYLSSADLRDIMDHCSRDRLDILLTITTAIEEFVCDGTSIKKYLEAEF